MKSVEIISVPVTDAQRAKEFYLKMGLTLVIEAPMDKDQVWVQLKFPGGGADIALVTWFSKMPAGTLQGNTILTDSIEEDRATLSEKGITVGKTDDTPWGKFAPITDPDGNVWTLHQNN
ncbi:MAG: glyoxalase [Flavipsychrobacter sp.]|nr:glyoxalase [Flavipsychrobacter sp.]